jgi:hypothetical protein
VLFPEELMTILARGVATDARIFILLTCGYTVTMKEPVGHLIEFQER